MDSLILFFRGTNRSLSLDFLRIFSKGPNMDFKNIFYEPNPPGFLGKYLKDQMWFSFGLLGTVLPNVDFLRIFSKTQRTTKHVF